MAKPPVSVIVPCYNGMPFVEGAFRGLLEQDYENMEILLSDDCSSDESHEVAEELAGNYSGPHRVRIFRNEKRLGMGNYNRLVELAEHDFIVMAHADDLPDPSRVSLLVDAWKESGATLIASNAMVASAENKDMHLLWANETSPDPTPEAVARKGRIDTGLLAATFAWHRDLFDRFGAIDPDKSPVISDWILPFRANLLNGIVYLNKPLVRFRRHAGTRWNRFFVDRGHPDREREYGLANFIVQRRYMQETLEQFLDANPEAAPRFVHLRKVLADALAQDLADWISSRNRLMNEGLRPAWTDSDSKGSCGAAGRGAAG